MYNIKRSRFYIAINTVLQLVRRRYARECTITIMVQRFRYTSVTEERQPSPKGASLNPLKTTSLRPLSDETLSDRPALKSPQQKGILHANK